MNAFRKTPACFLRWSVLEVTKGVYAVTATIDGSAYDFVGNYKSVQEAQQAGQRYVSNLLHGSLSGGRLSLRSPKDSLL